MLAKCYGLEGLTAITIVSFLSHFVLVFWEKEKKRSIKV